ncbi:MAG TPA: ribonuclease J, partial [Nitratifractor salsuginis]|nr:ribonuclease J [Nitratifractor salsuginis]
PQTGKLIDKPVVTSHGLVPDREDKQFAKDIGQLLESYLVSSPIEKSANPKVIEDDIRGTVRKHILKRYKKYPIIIPTVFLV